jgi:hypothetical protein
MSQSTIEAVHDAIDSGNAIPYLGPGVLSLGDAHGLPKNAGELVARIVAQSPVPGKLRGNLYGAAQFVENFKHRQTLRKAMSSAFQEAAAPNALHCFVAQQKNLRMIVTAWYDSLLPAALAGRSDWFLVQGASRADHREIWYRCFEPEGALADEAIAAAPQDGKLLVYSPLGGYWPEQNYLVSDSDFVEVLTEIDIQTPIPPAVQQLREGRAFLFLGCRFHTQMERQIARQIMKRSSDRHWAVLPDELTKNEERFLAEQHIEPIEMPLEEFVVHLAEP